MEHQPGTTTRLGDAEVEIRPLTTRSALRVARRILGYITVLRKNWDLVVQMVKAEDSEERVKFAFEFVEVLMDILEEDDLLRFLSDLLGHDVDVVGNAPLEDTINAVVIAFEVNDMPKLLKSVSRLGETVTGSFRGIAATTRPADEEAREAVPLNREQRRHPETQ